VTGNEAGYFYLTLSLSSELQHKPYIARTNTMDPLNYIFCRHDSVRVALFVRPILSQNQN